MSELINECDRGTPREDRVDIHVFEDGAAVGDLLARDLIQAGKQFLGAPTPIGLDMGDDDVLAALLALAAFAEHGERLSGSRRRAQIDLDTSLRRHLPIVLFAGPKPQPRPVTV